MNSAIYSVRLSTRQYSDSVHNLGVVPSGFGEMISEYLYSQFQSKGEARKGILTL